MTPRKILVMGLPGAGKTTFASALSLALGAVLWNADDVRKWLGDPGFTVEARIKQAVRMGYLCDVVNRAGQTAIADFVCPLPETRQAFDPDGKAVVVWIDRIRAGRFEDTNKLFVPPEKTDFHVVDDGRPAEAWVADFITGLEAGLV